MSMITASLWVPRGAAAPFPTKYEIDDDEIARISKLAQLQLDNAKGYLENSDYEQTLGESVLPDTRDDGVKTRLSRK